MGFLGELERFKDDVRKEWLRYYSIHRDFLDQLSITQGTTWYDEDQEGNDISWYLPKSEVILAVLLALRPDFQKELEFFAEQTGNDKSKIIQGIGLNFDIKTELDEQNKGNHE